MDSAAKFVGVEIACNTGVLTHFKNLYFLDFRKLIISEPSRTSDEHRRLQFVPYRHGSSSMHKALLAAHELN